MNISAFTTYAQECRHKNNSNEILEKHHYVKQVPLNMKQMLTIS